MAQDNIYDLTTSELILRLSAGTAPSSFSPALIISNSLNSTTVAENYNNTVTFSSDVVNIPSGYYVDGTTHNLVFPNGTPTVTGSTITINGSTTLILGAIGSTFIMNSSVTLAHATDPDILLTGTQTITSVLPIYYGVKAYQVTPDTAGLSTTSMNSASFDLAATSLGRLNVVLPTSLGSILSITGPNGLVLPISDFTLTTIGSLNHYVLNYDTQLTGTNLKTFTINYI